MDSTRLTFKRLQSIAPFSLPRFDRPRGLPKADIPAKVGIYFLFDYVSVSFDTQELQIIYVGNSKNIERRVNTHNHKFLYYAYIELHGGQRVGTFLAYLEAYFIAKLQPSINIVFKQYDSEILQQKYFGNMTAYIAAERLFLSTRPQYRTKNNWVE